MKFLFILFPILLSAFTLCGQTIVHLEEFGITTATDATPCVHNALQSVQGKSSIKLVLPKGTYHFYPDKAFGKYHCITNHDNGFRYFAFPLIGMANVEVDGQGAELIFHGQMIPFLFENANNITLRNLTIDWQIPFYIQGLVVANNQAENSIDIEIPDGYPNKLEGDIMYLSGEGWEFPFLGANLTWDTARHAVMYRAANYEVTGKNRTRFKAYSLSKNRYRIVGAFKKVPPVGCIITFSGMNNGENRTSPAIHSTSSSNITVENVVVHHACGMGFIAERTENIHLNNFNVLRRAGSDRMLTTTADATHFCGCKGRLLIENCIFENMLDDATNVHGTYLRIDSVISTHTVTARLVHHQQFGYEFAGTDDTIQLVNGQTLQPLGKCVVLQQEKVNSYYYKLTFKNALPLNVQAGDGLENITWYPLCTFRNNVVRNNRARSILISTRNKCVIEGNTFSSMMSGILFEGDLNYWHESGAVTDVEIRNNTFLDGGYGGTPFATIWINPRVKPTADGSCYERNISIKNNTFRTFDKPIINAFSVDGLHIENNTFEPSRTFEPIWKNLPTIKIRQSKNVVLKNNTYINGDKGNIELDSISKSTTQLKNMKGFSKMK